MEVAAQKLFFLICPEVLIILLNITLEIPIMIITLIIIVRT